MPFYYFRQNNSGGSFVYNDKLTHHVVIEAQSHTVANALAEDMGIYFDGVENDRDCPCCGDRWDAASESDGKPEPMVYSTPVSQAHNNDYMMRFMDKDQPEIRVHYLDGRVEDYWKD